MMNYKYVFFKVERKGGWELEKGRESGASHDLGSH
jgi:hypothetical protein